MGYQSLKSADVFKKRGLTTLADVLKKSLDDTLSPTKQRDLTSAFGRVSEVLNRPLEEIYAIPAEVRKHLAAFTAAQIGISEKTWANIRSLVTTAVRQHGGRPPQLTKRMIISPEWRLLLDKIETDHIRQSLYRLAAYGSAMNIGPEQVSSQTLVGLKKAVEVEELVKNPKNVLKGAITSWNRCQRTVTGWPQTRLHSPFRPIPEILPLENFPSSFQAELCCWATKMENPDPLDASGPTRALRPDTVKSRLTTMRQLASALVRSNVLPIHEVTSIECILRPEQFKAGLTHLYKKQGKKTLNLYHRANALRYIAQYHCKFDQNDLQNMVKLCEKLKPTEKRGCISQKNLKRLSQLDDREALQRYLTLPETLLNKAKRQKNEVLRARLVERALVSSLFINLGLRSLSLRKIKIDNLLFKQGTCMLVIPAEDTKNCRPLEFNLPTELLAILNSYLETSRPLLPGAESPYLIPGMNGGMKSKNAIYDIERNFKRDAGLDINPHLVRHVLGKIVVERNPSAAAVISQVLGHKSLTTTMRHYLGNSSKQAGDQIDDIFAKAKEGADNE